MFFMRPGHADILFGGVTVVSGVLGTVAGGLILDVLGGSETGAAAVCLASCALAFVLLQAAFRLCKSLAPFVGVFAVGQFVLFTLQAPITRIILLAVPTELQPLAFSIQTISIHVLGDVPSPPIAGFVHDTLFSPDDVVRFLGGPSFCFSCSIFPEHLLSKLGLLCCLFCKRISVKYAWLRVHFTAPLISPGLNSDVCPCSRSQRRTRTLCRHILRAGGILPWPLTASLSQPPFSLLRAFPPQNSTTLAPPPPLSNDKKEKQRIVLEASSGTA
jgi:hypothetical protein